MIVLFQTFHKFVTRSVAISFSHLTSTYRTIVISPSRSRFPFRVRKRKPNVGNGDIVTTPDNREYSYSFAARWQRQVNKVGQVKRETARRAVRNTSLLSSSEVASRHPSLLATSPPTSQYSSQLYTEAHAQLPRNLRWRLHIHPRANANSVTFVSSETAG